VNPASEFANEIIQETNAPNTSSNTSNNNIDQLDEIANEDRPLVAETDQILSRSRYTISIL
jgi:hypothetical protein